MDEWVRTDRTAAPSLIDSIASASSRSSRRRPW
jgi:hypothetical protein